MIVVKIELHSAVTKKITLLGSMIIHDTSGGGNLRDYGVKVARKPDAADLPKQFNNPQRIGEVLRYPAEAYNVWRLVSRAIRSAFPEEK